MRERERDVCVSDTIYMSHTMYILADVFWNIFICNIISIHIPTPVIQKI